MVHTRRLVAGGALGALIATTFIAPVAAPAFAAVLPSTSVKINEVVTSGGDPGDWIEFLNTGGEPVNLSGFIVRDDKDSNVFTFADGTIIAPGEYLVIDAVEDGVGDFDFGLGKEDQVRLFDPANVLIDEVSWSAHGAPSWGRLDSGELQQTLE
ncbi:MAG: lamin tail domain-containing protein, partial [Leucobacter sp.]|nr:lamin tail domain-containing protein [Leucobacter sp.]